MLRCASRFRVTCMNWNEITAALLKRPYKLAVCPALHGNEFEFAYIYCLLFTHSYTYIPYTHVFHEPFYLSLINKPNRCCSVNTNVEQFISQFMKIIYEFSLWNTILPDQLHTGQQRVPFAIARKRSTLFVLCATTFGRSGMWCNRHQSIWHPLIWLISFLATVMSASNESFDDRPQRKVTTFFVTRRFGRLCHVVECARHHHRRSEEDSRQQHRPQ